MDPITNLVLDPRLDPVIAEYLESVERGGPSDPRSWLERYPDLAKELEAFFAAEAQFDHLVRPFRSGSAPAAPADPLPLRTLEGYEILSELGRGGMGVIYKARHRALNRLVAVKMIRSAEWATPEDRLRFRWEAETVATLDHPNIVPIYEVGEASTGDGARLPFFSMKLIEGQSLARARERFRNDWKGIARLLYLIARALEHAHQRGVLHRDLKPANVLLRIGPDGDPGEAHHHESGFVLGTSFVTPHISDFGLARRAHHPRGGTLPGAILGTPSYLAPELTRGHEFATSASDVYGLGAILYELLTGVPPVQGETPLETIRLVATGAVKSPRKVNPAVPPDLETICLKCLGADPGERYSTSEKLAEDLERFLDHRPIAARPLGPLVRFGRWCRRRPAIAGLSGALVAVLLGSLPLILWNWHRAVEQERIAENHLADAQQERARADEAFELAHGAIADVFRLLAEDPWDDGPGSERSKKQLLENGLKYYRMFADRNRDDPKLRREVARALFQSGTIAARLGTQRDAVESFRAAIAHLRPLTKEHPDDTEFRELLGRALINLGNALSALNRLDEAVAAQEEAVEVWAQLAKDRPGAAEAAKEQASAWLNRGVAFQTTNDWQRARESFRRGQAVLAEHALTAKEPRLTVLLLLNVSQAEDHLGRREEALRGAHEAARIAERMLGAAPQGEDARLMTAYAARSVGTLSRKRGDPEAAKTNLQQAQKLLDELHQQRPREREYTWNLSLAHEDLAELADAQKQPLEALKALGRAEALMKELVERDGESHTNRASLARIERRLGRLHQTLGNTEATRKAFEQAKVHLEYLLAHDSPRPGLRSELAGVCHQLGVAFSKLQKHTEAAAAGAEAARHYRALLDRAPNDGSVRKNLSSVLGNVAIARRALRHVPEALQVTEERVDLWPNNPLELYDAATDFARSFDLIAGAKEPSPQLRERALNDAIDALRRALRAGFTDPALIRTAPRFAALRETAEFRAFLGELPGPHP